jgi:hypothetical protein
LVNYLDYVVYAVAALLLISVVLFVKAALFNKRPQKTGMVMALIAVPLYMIYYDDRWPTALGDLRMRDTIDPFLPNVQGADIGFDSDIAPALIVGGILLIHMTVLQRVAVRQRLQRVHNPIANFFAGATVATLIGGTLVSTFHWGWQGALIVAGVFTLVYLGALAFLAALLEVVAAIFQLFLVWIKRKIFAIATRITRASSWISSLAGRMGLRSFAERIRQDTMQQEATFLAEQEEQDRKLIEAYVRDRARRRRMTGGALPPDADDLGGGAPGVAGLEAAPPGVEPAKS